MSGLYETPKDILRVLTKLKFQPDHSAEAQPGPTLWELPRAIRQKRKTDVSVEVDERKGTWTIYSGETRKQGKGGAQLGRALQGLMEVLPPGRGLKDGVKQKNERRLTEKMITPQDITVVLGRHLHFSFNRHDDHDEWTSKNGRIGVDVYPGGRWLISFEEVRKKGFGVGPLIKAIRGFIDSGKSLKELTGTGGIEGFGTPYAFAGNDEDKKINEAFEALMEAGDPYYGWRNDETKTPRQKIGNAISEIHKQLREVEKVVKRTQRLKKETGTSNGALWNRTNTALMKIESRMHKISQTIRNMRG